MIKRFENDKNCLGRRIIILIFSGVLVLSLLLGGNVWAKDTPPSRDKLKNGMFYIDDKNLYMTMKTPADGSGLVVVDDLQFLTFVPLVLEETWLQEGEQMKVLMGDRLDVTLTFSERASSVLETLTYDLQAKRVRAQNDWQAYAYVLQWQPELKKESASAILDAEIKVRATVQAGDGTEVIEGKDMLTVVFRINGTDEEDMQESETESQMPPDSETLPPESEPESQSPEESETPAPTESETESEVPEETDPPGEGVPGGDAQIGDNDVGGNLSGDGPVSWGGDSGAGGTADTQKPEPEAKIRMVDCTVNLEEIHPGDTVTVNVTLKNSSVTTALQNIRVSFESATGEVVPADVTNSIYVDYMSAGGYAYISFDLAVGFSVTSQTQKIVLTMEYNDKKAAALTSAENIFLKITPSFDFRIGQPVIAPSVQANSTADITIDMVNSGGAPVKNVMCTLEMEGLAGAGTLFCGDVAAGEKIQAVMKTVVSYLKDENQNNKTGRTNGVIHVQYEDESGRVWNEDLSVSTEIAPEEGAKEPQETAEKSSQWWISIVCGLVAIQAVVMIILWINRRRRV